MCWEPFSNTKIFSAFSKEFCSPPLFPDLYEAIIVMGTGPPLHTRTPWQRMRPTASWLPPCSSTPHQQLVLLAVDDDSSDLLIHEDQDGAQ